MSFIAQFDLSQLPQPVSLPGLPTSGYLYFFCDQDQKIWGSEPEDKGSAHVYFTTEEPSKRMHGFPKNLGKHRTSALSPRFWPVPVAFQLFKSFPDPGRIEQVNRMGYDFCYSLRQRIEKYEDEVFGPVPPRPVTIFPPSGVPRHQIGGYPRSIQHDLMESQAQFASSGIRSGEQDWLLLLQVDTDADARMMWGDDGRLYFWIRQQDLAQHDFNNVWLIMENY